MPDAPLNPDSPYGSMIQIRLGTNLTLRLRELARRERTLLSLVVMTAYSVVMSNWCSERDLLLTFAINGRTRAELQNTVGFIANMFHFRVQIADEDTLIDLLRRVGIDFQSASCNQEIGTELVAERPTELNFNWRSVHGEELVVGAARSRIRVAPFPFRARIQHPFGLMFRDSGAEIDVTVQSRPDLIPQSAIDDFRRNLYLVAEEFCRNPTAPIHSMSLCTSAREN
jgi:hypothetical protein